MNKLSVNDSKTVLVLKSIYKTNTRIADATRSLASIQRDEQNDLVILEGVRFSSETVRLLHEHKASIEILRGAMAAYVDSRQLFSDSAEGELLSNGNNMRKRHPREMGEREILRAERVPR